MEFFRNAIPYLYTNSSEQNNFDLFLILWHGIYELQSTLK